MSYEDKLSKIRESIDNTDRLLYDSIMTRVMLTSEIGLLKKEYGVTDMCEVRRNEILSKVKQWAVDDTIPVHLVTGIFELLIDNSVLEQVLIIHEKE
jgi:chorismate mutase